MKAILARLAVVVCFITPLTAMASDDPLLYGSPGSENTTLYSFTAMETGTISAYFYGATAAYTNTLSMWVNGVVTSETAAGVLSNKATNNNAQAVLGSVKAGDVISFSLNVTDLGNNKYVVYSDATKNADGVNHIYATSFSGNNVLPSGTYVAFEDLVVASDYNYNDMNFVITNIAAAVPEPESYAMLMAGLGLLGVVARRRKPAATA